MRHRGHVSGCIVRWRDPGGTDRVRDPGDLVHGIRSASLIQGPQGTRCRFVKAAPVSGRIESPALGEVRRCDRRVRSVERASLHVFQTLETVVGIMFVEICPCGRCHGVLSPDPVAGSVVAVFDSVEVRTRAGVVPTRIDDSPEQIETPIDVTGRTVAAG